MILYFAQKQPIKLYEFEFQKLVKFFLSILKQQVNSFSDFSSFYGAITHSSSVNF